MDYNIAIYQKHPAYKIVDFRYIILFIHHLHFIGIAQSKCLYYEKTMFKIRLRDSFSSAHMLRGYQGDCERLHGHNYRIEVTICSPDLNEIGIIADFRDIKQSLKDCLNPLDHRLLNDLQDFSSDNPSAENIARHIFLKLKPIIKEPAKLFEVEVWENDNCSALFSEG